MRDTTSGSDTIDVTDADGNVVARSTSSGLATVAVTGADGGVIFVAAPEGATVEEATALLGEPGELKGPSPTVWGDEHAAAFLATDEEAAVAATPQGEGEPVKARGENFDAPEVLD